MRSRAALASASRGAEVDGGQSEQRFSTPGARPDLVHAPELRAAPALRLAGN
jgi:hypothetical protein